MKKRMMAVLLVVAMVFTLAGCTEADRVSENVSQEADNFNVLRRLAGINSRTDKVEFELIGAFSLDVESKVSYEAEMRRREEISSSYG